MNKYIFFFLVGLLILFSLNGCKYIFNEEKAQNIVTPALVSISSYIKLNHTFPIDLNEIKSFPYKKLEKKHREDECDTCYFYPLKNNIYSGYTIIETGNWEKSKFYFRVLFADVKIGVNSCDYLFDINGTYSGKCYKASGFGVNR